MRTFFTTLTVAVVACLFFVRPLISLFSFDSSPVETVVRFHSDESQTMAQGLNLFKEEKGITGKDGFIYFDASHNACWIESALSFQSQQLTTLHISAWLQGKGSISLTLEDKTTGQTHILSHQPILRHRDFDLTPYLKMGHEYAIVMKPLGTAANTVGVLHEFCIKKISGLPNFPRLDSFFMGLIGLFFLLQTQRGASHFRWVTISVILTAGFIAAVTSQSWFHHSQWVWFIFLSLCLILRLKSVAPQKRAEYIASSFSIWITVLAFSLRWQILSGAAGHSLEGDAPGYFDLASSLRLKHPFSTGIREPFYVWVQYVGCGLLGGNAMAFRAVTVFLSSATVLLTIHLAALLSKNKGVGYFAAILVAVGQFVVWNSTRGERSELYTFLVLGFCYLSVKVRTINWKMEGFLGAMAGLVSLTWLIGAVACVLVYVSRWWRFRISIKQAIFFFIVLGALITPHLLYQYRTNGDPLRALNAHTDYYRNAVMKGTPLGEGSDRTFVQFFFVEHGLRMLKDTLFGYAHLFLNPVNPFNRVFLGFHYTQQKSLILFPFLVLGVLVCALRRNGLAFTILFSLLNVSVALLSQVRDPRLFLHAAFFVAFFWGAGMEAVLSRPFYFFTSKLNEVRKGRKISFLKP